MVIFVNSFTVPAGNEDHFLQLWQAVNVYMAAKPGYVDHTLHRSVDPAARFRFVNIAHWESPEAWRAAHDAGFRAMVTAPEWAGYPSFPVLYDAEPVHQGTAEVSAQPAAV